MNCIAEFLFEAHFLKKIKRTGYQFLGTGNESVAEHSFITTIVGWVMTQMDPLVKENRVLLMCLMHDLPEARIGDINYVQKEYINENTMSAISNLAKKLDFGSKIQSILSEFNEKKTLESKFANDADQLAFMIDLKNLKDSGHSRSSEWIKKLKPRLFTTVGLEMYNQILKTESSSWWTKIFIDKDKICHT